MKFSLTVTNTAAVAEAAAAAVPTDATAYYNDYWQYSTYYGEAAARVFYGAWSPPLGTLPPPGIVVATPEAAAAAMAAAGMPAASAPAATEATAAATTSTETTAVAANGPAPVDVSSIAAAVSSNGSGDSGVAAATAEGGAVGDAAEQEEAAVAWELYKKQVSVLCSTCR